MSLPNGIGEGNDAGIFHGIHDCSSVAGFCLYVGIGIYPASCWRTCLRVVPRSWNGGDGGYENDGTKIATTSVDDA